MRWLAAIAVSALAHVGLFILVALSVTPDPVPQQPATQSRLDISAYAVDQSDAVATAPIGERTAEETPVGAEIGGAAVPLSRADPGALVAPSAAAADEQGVSLGVIDVAAQSADVSAAARPGELLVSETVAGAVVTAVLTPPPYAILSTPPSTLGAVQIEGRPMPSTAATSTTFDAAVVRESTVSGADAALVVAAAGPVAVPAVIPAIGAPPARPNIATLTDLSPRDAETRAGIAQLSSEVAAVADLGETADNVAATPPPTNSMLQEESPVFAAVEPDLDAQTAVVIPEPSDAPQLASLTLPGAVAPNAKPRSQDVIGTSLQGEARPAPTAVLEAAHVTAALVWSGDGNGQVDPVSLAAIQSFMQPGDLAQSEANAGTARDGIAKFLASVPCSRLQTIFVPQTGQLELRGHIPEEGLRAPILAALQAQIGGSIPVSDNTLILPRPTCGALAGIANVGLPQSTEQDSNPRVVGPDTHARVYRFQENDRLAFDLIGPDYPAYFYIDYFDANGMVVHLQPNEIAALAEIEAKQTLVVGRDAQGRAALDIRVSPPFGQEIMVAFAASTPLYDGVRPLQELAVPYLDFLREQVARARSTTSDFKGEWVYFFVETSSR